MNAPTLDPDIYLHAAELLDDSARDLSKYPTHEFCCTTIVYGAKGSGRHREAFVDVFYPVGEARSGRHGPFFSFDPDSDSGEPLPLEETQPHRVIALCLMAAMVEAGDVP